MLEVGGFEEVWVDAVGHNSANPEGVVATDAAEQGGAVGGFEACVIRNTTEYRRMITMRESEEDVPTGPRKKVLLP